LIAGDDGTLATAISPALRQLFPPTAPALHGDPPNGRTLHPRDGKAGSPATERLLTVPRSYAASPTPSRPGRGKFAAIPHHHHRKAGRSQQAEVRRPAPAVGSAS
jgi:hypothetical protein